MKSKTTLEKFPVMLQFEKAKIMYRKNQTSFSKLKCELYGCDNSVGIVSIGQEKRFCSPDCRARRHRATRN